MSCRRTARLLLHDRGQRLSRPLRDQSLPALHHQTILHQGQRATNLPMGAERIIEVVQRRLDEHPEKMRQRRKRSSIPGTVKARMGTTHFLMKTLPKVASEMALHVLAYNLTRVVNHGVSRSWRR